MIPGPGPSGNENAFVCAEALNTFWDAVAEVVNEDPERAHLDQIIPPVCKILARVQTRPDAGE